MDERSKMSSVPKINSSFINHTAQAKAKIIVLVLTIIRKKGYIPTTMTSLLSQVILNSSVFVNIGRTKNRNSHLNTQNPRYGSKE